MEVEEAADASNIISDDDDDDDDDESYVPDSLRDFLKAADKKLEEDLAGFLLSPPEELRSNVPIRIGEEDDTEGDAMGNSILAQDLKREMERAKQQQQQQRDLEKAAAAAAAMEQARELAEQKEIESENQKERERERMKIEQDELQSEQKKQKLLEEEESNNHTTTNNNNNKKKKNDDEDNYQEDDDPTMPSPLLDMIHPSADVSNSHLKKIAMEGADQEESVGEDGAQALQPLVAMVVESPMMIGGGGGGTNTNTNTTSNHDERSNGSAFLPSPLPSTKVGRKLQMELDAVQTLKREELNTNADEMDIENNSTSNSTSSSRNSSSNDNNNDLNVSFQESLDEKRKSMDEKKQRLQELKARSMERRTRLKEIEEQNTADRKKPETVTALPKLAEEVAAVTQARDPLPEHATTSATAAATATATGGDVTPSVAAAAAANKAAAVVGTANPTASDEGPTATLDIGAAKNESTNSNNNSNNNNNITKNPTTKPMPRKLAVTGPVKALASPQQRRQKQQPRQNFLFKRAFRTRNPRSPPRPTEIITTTNFSAEDGKSTRSVSPLGGVDETQSPVSPLASPATSSYRRPAIAKQKAAAPILGSFGFVRDYNDDDDDDDKPSRPSPSRRRQLTKPDSAFDRLSRPTASSNAGKKITGGAVRQRKQTAQKASTINPEDERRKARERIRKRMAVQRKKAKPTSHNHAASGGGTTNAAEKAKADARKERMERMEEERLAKIQAKIKSREERMQALKKQEEAKKNKLRLKLRAAATTRQPGKDSENKAVRPKLQQQSHQGGSKKPALTIPVAPKFATDRRMTLSGSNKKTNTRPKERLSLASSAGMFGQGLRSSTPTMTKETPGPRRLTIPLAPKFATSQRFGDKVSSSTPFASPSKKNKRADSSDNVSWSSMLRDVSGIGSPSHKSTSSVKTGPLTIPMTPQFQPIRKRPLPKSTAEKEMEEIEYYKEHPFKARMVNMHKTTAPRSRLKKPTPKRKLTTPEPFQFHKSIASSKRDHQEQAKTEKSMAATTFKATPMPSFSSKVSISGSKKKSPRTLTKPESFQFHSSTSTSKRSNNAKSHKDEPIDEKFKALPMPDFKSSRMSLGSKKTSPTSRTLTTPEPFQFHSTSSKRSNYAKSGEEPTSETFKAMPMPDFKSGSKNLSSPPARPVTTPEPFKFHGHSSSKRRDEKSPENGETAGGATFKARPMPSFASNHKKSDDRTKRKSSRSSNRIPTGASGLLFHRSLNASSRLNRPKVAQDQSKPFRARPMPDFIPDVIVTRTPIKDQGEGKQDQEMGDELDSILSDDHPSSGFSARPMPDFNKVEIPVKEKNFIKSRTSPHKEGENPVTSPVFKASPAPKHMLGEPSIPVRVRDPNKLRSPESFVKPTTKSAAFRARPVPDSLYVEPSPIGKLKSPVHKTTLNSPVASPPRIQRENQSSNNSNDIMGDAKARMRERLSQRKSNAAAVKAATPDRAKSKYKNINSNSNTAATEDSDKILTSPKAFSTARVQSLLNSHSQANATREEKLQNSKPKPNLNIDSANKRASGSKTPKKSNSTIPKSIDLPFRSASPDTEKEANLLRETKLALAMGVPDGDESSSILQLAQEVQKAAEDELSFYSTADTKDHWSSSLADGRPHNLL